MEDLLRFSMMNGQVQIPSVSLSDWVFKQSNPGDISSSKSAEVLKNLQATLPHSKTIWWEFFSRKWLVFIGLTILLSLCWIVFETQFLDSQKMSIKKSPVQPPSNKAGLITVIPFDSSLIVDNRGKPIMIEKASKETQINYDVKSTLNETSILTEVHAKKTTPATSDSGIHAISIPSQTLATEQPEETGGLVSQDLFDQMVDIRMDSVSQQDNLTIFYKRNSVGYSDRSCKDYDKISALAQWMKSNPNKNILLIGYMDQKEKQKAVKHAKSCKSSHCNYKSVAQSRVDLLQSFFINKGIDDSRIVTSLDSTEVDVADQQEVRKVEIIIR
ncbi:MAG: hypothetical protein WC341_09180 [Bacteroidales bacterium]